MESKDTITLCQRYQNQLVYINKQEKMRNQLGSLQLKQLRNLSSLAHLFNINRPNQHLIITSQIGIALRCNLRRQLVRNWIINTARMRVIILWRLSRNRLLGILWPRSIW